MAGYASRRKLFSGELFLLTAACGADNLLVMVVHAAPETLEMAKKEAETTSILTEALEALMWLHGWNQQEVADRWGVSQGTVSKILAGENQHITYPVLQRFITAFELDPGLPHKVREPKVKK